MATQNNPPTYVTKPNLPPLEEFIPYLEKIWDKRILTNNGPFHQQLEGALCDYLGVTHISLFTNATIALITSLQALRVTGEVITTPYTFVATAHSLLWNGITPVFVDIDSNTLNLDPNKIEAAITERTTGIMPVHCYGAPCDVDAIQRLADRYGLKVIYDAAHAFGVKYNGRSVLNHGDLSIISFHATKVFNTFEGGAIVCPDAETKQHIDQLKNFGFVDEVTVVSAGINGKMSEVNAAMGLLQLKYVDKAIERRGEIDAKYRTLLRDITGIRCIQNTHIESANYSYFPLLVEDAYPISRDSLYELLKASNIHCRRYFYPLVTDFPIYRELPSSISNNFPTAIDAALKVLCLPIYPELNDLDVEYIAQLINEAGGGK